MVKTQEFLHDQVLGKSNLHEAILYSFKIREEKNIGDQIDEFIKILDDLENIVVKLDEEDKALISWMLSPNCMRISEIQCHMGKISQ